MEQLTEYEQKLILIITECLKDKFKTFLYDINNEIVGYIGKEPILFEDIQVKLKNCLKKYNLKLG